MYTDLVDGNQIFFNSREETGMLLAEKLQLLELNRPIVIAIPRGGVVIGCEVAKRIDADLDIVTPRKIPAPQNPELALGAAMHDGSTFLNQEAISASNASPVYIETKKESAINESARRLAAYRGSRAPVVLKGRTVILVDDGIATGATMEVAIKWAKGQNPDKLIVAIPVIPASILARLRERVNHVVFIEAPEFFYAIGQFYKIFEQVDDKEVTHMLQEYWKSRNGR